jgi:hypothetical protein
MSGAGGAVTGHFFALPENGRYDTRGNILYLRGV